MPKFTLIRKGYHSLQGIEHNLRVLLLGGPYRKNAKEFTAKNTRESFEITKKFRFPILTDRYLEAGSFSSYFWQDLWAARLIHDANPAKHYDIGSRVDGFIAHLASFREDIILIDIRPLSQKIPGVDFIQADATLLENIPDNSLESLSSLCALEHFGLGRYGDPVDPEACFKAFAAIQRVMQPGGKIYISIPIGKEHIEFDAHRVFFAQTIVDNFPQMDLIEFSVTTGENIEYGSDLHAYDEDMTFGGNRFGLFAFAKKVSIS